MLNRIILWTARGLSIFSLFFIGMFLAGEFFSEQASTFTSNKEIILFCFFPIGLCLGLIYSWKNAFIGGAISTICIIAFHLLETKIGFNVWLDGLALPGALFLIHGLISKFK